MNFFQALKKMFWVKDEPKLEAPVAKSKESSSYNIKDPTHKGYHKGCFGYKRTSNKPA